MSGNGVRLSCQATRSRLGVCRSMSDRRAWTAWLNAALSMISKGSMYLISDTSVV